MKPIDPSLTPAHVGHTRGGRTGLVHGPAPELSRAFVHAHLNRAKQGRKGAKARAKMLRILRKRGSVA